MRWLVAMVLASLSSMPLCAKDTCRFAKKPTVHQLSSNFVLRLIPIDPDRTGDGCRAELVDPNKKLIFLVVDWDLELVLNGVDVNGDGAPDIVLEGYSGGAHCCWTYYFVSLGGHPGLVRKLENDRPAAFPVKPGSGRIEIATMDGAFDYFYFLSHAETPFPDVFLRLDGKVFVDISKEHVADYDREIRDAEDRLDPVSTRKFKSAPNEDALAGDTSNRHTASLVLQIVFAYLYNGRQTQAREVMKQMWPAFNEDVVWSLILETRRKGILRYTRRSQG